MPRQKSAGGLTPSKARRSVSVTFEADNEPPAKRRRTSPKHQSPQDDANGTIDAVEDQEPQSLQPAVEETPRATPTPRRRGRPPKSQTTSTPSRTPTRAVLETPVKIGGPETSTPQRHAADRSARRKSARALIANVVGDSDDDDGDDALVREIYEDSEAFGTAEEEVQDDDGDDDNEQPVADQSSARQEDGAGTPSKPRPQRKGRSPRRPKSPTPPRDLPPHELYFAHNKPGRPKTSDNTLSSLRLLTHDEYFAVLRGRQHRHANDVEYLENLHADMFPQWGFELSQNFSICLYGFGSKRGLMRRFATYLHQHQSGGGKGGEQRVTRRRRIVMVNGYAHATTSTTTSLLREILTCLSQAVRANGGPGTKLPATNPAAMLHGILSHLSRTSSVTLTLFVNSIDAAPLRKPGTQALIAQLAAHPQVNLVCSADTPDFSLLWDMGLRSAFNFVFHDCTTFAPCTAELDAVDDVHELLGRKARRVNGREGVAFVLRSLPENAKNLFRLLVGEVLVAMEEEDDNDDADDDAGVEYKMVYNKAVEEFICSSEMAFRTLLKEFYDHQMITSRKDALGTELLTVPFQKDELEAILEDLVS